jgi:hypothetical protein
MSLTSTTPFDALRHDIMTQCGTIRGEQALETLANGPQNAPLHKISSRNPYHKLLENLTWGTDRQASGCWIWNRTLLPNGYAQLSVKGEKHYVHRLFYLLTYGPIGDGLQIDHLCRNRACCRPDHLEAVTCRVNLFRAPTTRAAIHAAKTHCIKGHRLSGSNLYVYWYSRKGGPKRPTRVCRACKVRHLRQVVS